MKPKQVTFERLRIAYRFIKDIPDEAIALDAIQQKAGKGGANCGTVACAAGWLTRSPAFQAMGLSLPKRYGTYVGADLCFDEQEMDWDHAMARVLDVNHEDAAELFGPRGSVYDIGFDGSDKDMWLRRVEKFFAEHGEKLDG